MSNQNTTPTPEDAQTTHVKGLDGAACSPSYDPCWLPPLFAPKDRKIMAFFEDIGWHPACWSEAKQMWKIAYCAGIPDTNPEEPKWIERMVYEDDLCWWQEWPNSTHPSHYQQNAGGMARELAAQKPESITDLNG